MSRTRAVVALVPALALAGPAVAACEPTDEGAFRSLTLDAQAAVDRGDLELSTAIVEETLAALPCLTFAPPPRVWADFLVALAIVDFARGEDWAPALTTALHIRPLVDRGVASGHPLAAFEPPPAPARGEPVPDGARVYVDGLQATRLPSEGLHLVQRTDGRFWNTLLVDGPPPPGWAAGKVEQPPRIAGWLTVGGVIGYGRNEQAPDWASDWIAAHRAHAAAIGVAIDAAATFWSPFGLAASASAPVAGGTSDLDGRLAAIWTVGAFTVGAGAGFHAVDTLEGDDRRATALRYGFGTAQLRAGARWRWDVGLVGGGGSALVRGALRLGVVPPDAGSGRWRLGVDLQHTEARFVQVGAPRHTVRVGQSRAVLQLGLVLGEY